MRKNQTKALAAIPAKAPAAAKTPKPSKAATKVSVFQGEDHGDGLRIAIVQSRFNQPVCEGLRNACIEELLRLGVKTNDIFVCTVPGALEIPVALQRIAGSGEFDALVALGAVIRGETYHFELVSNEIGRGVSQVQLDFNVPIANGVLTVDTQDQAQERIVEKAQDCAQCAVEMANLLIALDGLSDSE